MIPLHLSLPVLPAWEIIDLFSILSKRTISFFKNESLSFLATLNWKFLISAGEERNEGGIFEYFSSIVTGKNLSRMT